MEVFAQKIFTENVNPEERGAQNNRWESEKMRVRCEISKSREISDLMENKPEKTDTGSDVISAIYSLLLLIQTVRSSDKRVIMKFHFLKKFKTN
jgi:hypothetical protein